MVAQWQGSDLILHCRIQPKASRSEFAGPHGDRLKIRIAAPPVDGEANAALLRFLAKAFGVTQKQVTLLRGEQGREKSLCINKPQRLPDALAGLIPPR